MILKELLKNLEKSGWILSHNESKKNDIYNMVPKDRYPNIPKEYIEFFNCLNVCVDKTDQNFFLLKEDHSEIEQEGFSWKFCELLSLENSSSEKETNEIISFWDKYFPIALSVSGDYAVYAINLKDDVGAIYYTYAPMFEDGITKISDSFHDFLKLICDQNFSFDMGLLDEDEDDELDEDGEYEETEEEKALFAEIDAEIAAEEADLERKKKKKES